MNETTIYYLEMKSSSSLKGKKNSQGLKIYECKIRQYQFNRFLYQFVGEFWEWSDKLLWSDDEWKAYAENNNLRTWVAYFKGSPAGYYELQQQNGGDVEIAYFGLAQKFIGKGLGGYLLFQAIKSAWEWKDTRRVWVHTCNLDHPNALPNYKARCMKVYNVETTNKGL